LLGCGLTRHERFEPDELPVLAGVVDLPLQIEIPQTSSTILLARTVTFKFACRPFRVRDCLMFEAGASR
jgi:hypothetical protein